MGTGSGLGRPLQPVVTQRARKITSEGLCGRLYTYSPSLQNGKIIMGKSEFCQALKKQNNHILWFTVVFILSHMGEGMNLV